MLRRIAMSAITCLLGCGRLAFDERVDLIDAANSSGDSGSGAPTGDGGTGSFGTSQIGISTQNTSTDRVWISQFMLTEPANVQQLVVHFASTSGAGTSVRGVIYADSNGTPTALVGSTSVVLASQLQAAWVPLPFASPVALTPGQYWLGTHNSSAIAIAYQSATGLGKFANDVFSDGPDATYAGNAQTFTLQLSVYAEYTK